MRMRKTMLMAAALLLTMAGMARAEGPVLNVYNWSDYIGKDTVQKFEKETGITVHYDVYDQNETLEAKLSAGHSGYDVVVPSSIPYLARMAQAHIFLKLDKSKLTNYGNLDPKILASAAVADPGNTYGVPYMWGTTGIGYNADKVTAALGANAPADSLKLLFDPENAKKLAACGISLLDTPDEVFPAALAYLGRPPLSRDEKDLERAYEVVKKIRPFIKKFHSSQYINDLANGDLCVVLGYSGDVFQAQQRAEEAKNGVNIAYAIPKEGAMLWIDQMAIPADAPHPENALKWINFILRPEIAADISNAVAYANPNAKATPLVDPAIRDNPNIYPSEAVKQRLFFDTPVTPQYARERTRLWTRVKTGT
jgi:putrescine transport system substrate-binding protein